MMTEEILRERLCVIAEMTDFTGDWNGQYHLICLGDSRRHKISATRLQYPSVVTGELRFNTKADALRCVGEVGEDRIRRYYFMVPEEDNDGID